MKNPKIRFGILCNGMHLEKWQERAISRLLQLDGIELSLVILNGEKNLSNPTQDRIKKLFSSNLLFWIYYALIRRRFESKKKVDMTSVFAKTSQIICTPDYKGKYSQYFSSADIKTISEYKLDFLLRFGFDIIRGDILTVAKYGVWSFHHDNEQKYRGGPPCFWEIYSNDQITGAILQRLTDRLDGGVILNKGYFPTLKHSYVQNLDRTYFASAEWPAKICRSLLAGKDSFTNNPASETKATVYKLPNNIQMLKFLFKLSYNFTQFLFSYLFKSEEWNIGIIDKPIHSVLMGDIERNWLPNPSKGTFVADPFGKTVKGKTYVFVEDLDHNVGRGHISAIEINNLDTKNYSKKIAIKLSDHMSYPYVIDYNNETYLIPETYESRKVRLFKALDFPNHWKEVSTLIENFAAVDTTVFQYNDYWWLMCTNRETDSNSDLYIWYSKDLLGPWKQHHANPVKTDVRSSRPGGTPFLYQGELYRPAQNSAQTYGGSLMINKVTKLTVDEFEEEVALEIYPDSKSLYNKGVHTLSSLGEQTVIDGKRFVFLPSLFRNRFFKVVEKLTGLSLNKKPPEDIEETQGEFDKVGAY